MREVDALRLEAQIRSEFPHFSPIVLKTPGNDYWVQIKLFRFEYSKWESVEYADFVRVAQANGFEVDIPPTDLLINPKVAYVDITTPGQWALFKMIGTDISDEKAMQMLRAYDCPACRYAA